MKPGSKSQTDRLKSAALVKLKYQMITGKMDKGFQTIYAGVLQDLDVTEGEVDRYIQKHRKELERICFDESPRTPKK